MLGVRRAGVTTTLRELEQKGLVARNRGNVSITDREGLVMEADGYYGLAERLFGPEQPGTARNSPEQP